MSAEDHYNVYFANKYDPETMAAHEKHVQVIHQNCYPDLDIEIVREALSKTSKE